jgi:hypothetical protein
MNVIQALRLILLIIVFDTFQAILIKKWQEEIFSGTFSVIVVHKPVSRSTVQWFLQF